MECKEDFMENHLLYLFEECLKKEYTEERGDVSWSYDRAGDCLYLWFEHSNGIRDWLNNISFASAPYREMDPEWRCHAGFLKVWKIVRPIVEPLIMDRSVQRICIVGYSHGAAIALLCHEFVWYHRPDLREHLCGYGFGCPRVLYGCLPPEIAERWSFFWRICNVGDLVTHLPPKLFGYCHVGNCVEIGEFGRYSDIDAHRPENYLTELRNLDENAQNPHVDGRNTY